MSSPNASVNLQNESGTNELPTKSAKFLGLRFPFRLTLSRKIGLGFGILIFFTLINFIITFITLHKSRKLSDDIIDIYTPSVDALEELNVQILNSNMLISNWVHVQSGDDNFDKQNLKKLINEDYPALKLRIIALSSNWSPEEKSGILKIFQAIDELFRRHKEIMGQLNSFNSYEDPMIVFQIRPLVEGGEVDLLTRDILKSLDIMINKEHKNTSKVSNEMISAFNLVQSIVTISGFFLIAGGIIVAFATIRTIVKPVTGLKDMLLLLGKGVMPETKVDPSEDEIGEMTIAMNGLVDGLKRTSSFSREVGAGNFESSYVPLSDKDQLGHSLLLMRNDLKELTSNLEQKVNERTEQLEAEKKKTEVLLEAVTDSIKYASRIQQSFLPTEIVIKRSIPEHFILYKPKDIVSGDFYWFDKRKDSVYFAAVDCTGHGVPGALMSIIGNFILNQTVASGDGILPGQILDGLNEGVTNTLKIGQAESVGSKDGMDITLVKIDYKNKKLFFAGAFNPLYLVRNGEISEIKTDKFPIGHYAEEPERKYQTQEIDIQKDDMFYIFTDGYADQFGGPLGKKFMYKKFREILVNSYTLPMQEQKAALDNAIETWRGDLEQVDDILVMGFRIS